MIVLGIGIGLCLVMGSFFLLMLFWNDLCLTFPSLQRLKWKSKLPSGIGLDIVSRCFWILVGIVLPLVAIVTEKLTEICAHSFFDPLPTDWHVLFFALIPLSNLAGELSSIMWIRERAHWLGGPVLKWINGMAIGISTFYAIWFFPMALICSMLLLIGSGALVVMWPWEVITCLIKEPSLLLRTFLAPIWAPPIGGVLLGTLLLIPLAPFMSFLACLRIREKLFSFSTTPVTSDSDLTHPEVVPVHPRFIALGLSIYGVSLYIMFKYWLPYIFSGASALAGIAPSTPTKDIWLTWAPPVMFFLVFFWPTPISPLGWFRGQRAVKLAMTTDGKPFERLLLPAAFGLFALLAIEIPSTATRVAMSMALDPNKGAQGLLLLRAFGNDDSMLRMCYERSHATDIIGTILTWNKPVPADKAREMYYRATGRPFNTRFVPASFRGKINDFIGRQWETGADDVFDWDAELAGETVGGVVRGVSLAKSNIKGNIDAKSHTATLDWEMQFENKSQFLREARAQILLPPHAVVSGVWLWINGTPHPAAFNSRGLTRAAYRAVVKRRRDPLLVTTYGPDRVLAQCFPVPPNGAMHIKLSITAPLTLLDDGKAYLPMPIFLERNFQVASHECELDANDNVSNPAGILLTGDKIKDAHELKGSMSNQDLCLGKGTIALERKGLPNLSWSEDSENNSKVIVAHSNRRETKKPEKLIVVVDGSAAMAENATKLAQCLKTIPEGIRFSLIRAGDKVEEIATDVTSSSDPKWASALETLQSQTFVGGQDDVAALVKAFDLLQNHEQAAILWLHGPQPVKIEKTEALADLLRQNQSNLTLYELQMENGPNRTAEALDGIANVSRIPIIISTEAALKEFFSQLAGGGSGEYEMSFEKTNASKVSALSKTEKSTIDLSPLWANQEIAKLRDMGATDKSKYAVEIAKQYRVVTPVSGAVVLESDKDYRRFGLTVQQAKSTVSNGATSTGRGRLSGLLGLTNTTALAPMQANDSQKAEFEQRAPSVQHSAQSDSTSESNSELTASDDSTDVSAVPEPDSWIFLLSIGIFLYAFRKKLFPAIAK